MEVGEENVSMHALTPEVFDWLDRISRVGSIASAARTMGIVPSALSYRVQQLEKSLGIPIFDRTGKKAVLTAAGSELLREGRLILQSISQLTQRVKRVGSGWEPGISIAVDSIIDRLAVMDLVRQFQETGAQTRVRLRDETLSGTQNAVLDGSADLAIGVVDMGGHPLLQSKTIGDVPFVFVVSPAHPLAHEAQPLSDSTIARHRIVTVADSSFRQSPAHVGILPGQDTLTTPSLAAKRQAQIMALGCGYLPFNMVESDLAEGRLIQLKTEQPARVSRVSFAFKDAPKSNMGQALRWWINALEQPDTKARLLRYQNL
jgi:molybdate transport repressor ModE-like protein